MGILKVDAITDLNDQPIYGPVLGTPQTPSGTTADFTGIPSWAKKVTILFDGISFNNTAQLRVQLGDSGGIENTGYSGWVTTISATEASTSASSGIDFQSAAGSSISRGSITLFLINSSTNLWLATINLTHGSSDVHVGSVSKSLSSTLTQVRITTVAGTATFDAGSINVMWE